MPDRHGRRLSAGDLDPAAARRTRFQERMPLWGSPLANYLLAWSARRDGPDTRTTKAPARPQIAPGLLFGRAEARRNSDALENLCASYPAAGEISAPPCDDGSRTDEAPGPVRGHVAIRCPVPPSLEDHPGAPNASSQPIRNSWTWSCWATDENSGEISSSINPQHLQHSAPLRLPHRGE